METVNPYEETNGLVAAVGCGVEGVFLEMGCVTKGLSTDGNDLAQGGKTSSTGRREGRRREREIRKPFVGVLSQMGPRAQVKEWSREQCRQSPEGRESGDKCK